MNHVSAKRWDGPTAYGDAVMGAGSEKRQEIYLW
jgi:hypothetical protein